MNQDSKIAWMSAGLAVLILLIAAVYYPSIGISRNGMRNGNKCGHPRQVLQPNGECRCQPFPDVLFTPHEIDRWCNSTR